MALKKTNKADAIERLGMRVTQSMKNKYSRAAALRGETVSGWAKSVLDEAAEKQIREHELTELSLADKIAFVQAVLNPPKPTKSAVTAAKRYKQMFGT
jgi:uncharacterized protein (DUF1778 family)